MRRPSSPRILLALLLLTAAGAAAYGQPSPETPPASSLGSQNLRAVVYANGLFVAVGDQNQEPYSHVVLTSPEGQNWRTALPGSPQPGYLSAICFGNGQFVAVGGSYDDSYPYRGLVARSTNGVDWTDAVHDSLPAFNGVACGNGIFVATSSQGIFSSTNATTWISQGWAFANPNCVAYGNGRFVVGGSEGTVLVSTNGVVWSPQNSRTSGNVLKLARGNGIFVALAQSQSYPYPTNYYLASADGLNWVPRSEHTNDAASGLAFARGLFFRGFSHPAIQFSSSAVSWQSRHTGASALADVTYGNGSFVAVGPSGTVVTSPDASLWTLVGQPLTAPFILSPPANANVLAGDTAVFTVAASGNPAPAFRWQFNGAELAASPISVLQVDNSIPENSGDYTVVAENSLGSVTSAVAWLTVVAQAPFFSSEPIDLSSMVGDSPCLTSTAEGAPRPGYQWFFNGLPIPGGTEWLLCLTNVGLDDAGAYSVVASNLGGAITSRFAALTVSEQAPFFDSNPASVTLDAGADTAFYSQARGGPWPAYQWQHNGLELPGATNAELRLYGTMPDQAGDYQVVASNALGVVTSRVAVLTVSTYPPAFVAIPGHQTVVEGRDASFTVNARGAPPPVLNLQFKGTNLANPYRYGVFSLLETTPADAGAYTIVASNVMGVATSQVAQLQVIPGGPLDRWTRRNPLPQGNELFGLAHGQGTFVAVGERGGILTSIDGSRWTSQSIRTEAILRSAAFGAGQFVAVGDDANILSSADGTNWVLRVSGRQGMDLLLSVAYGNGLFLAAGYRNISGYGWLGHVWTSTNGITWTPNYEPAWIWFRHLTFGNGLFVAVGDNNDGVWTSRNGSEWALQTWSGSHQLHAMAFGNGLFVGVGGSGLVMVSSDATNWVTQSAGTWMNFRTVSFGNGRFVAAGSRGVLFSSVDGLSWTEESSGTPDRLQASTFAQGKFIVAGENGTIITSPDASHWAKQNRGTTRDLDGMAVGNGLMVVAGKYGTILTSTDGVRYQEWSSGTTNDLHGVAFGNDGFLAVGEYGSVLTSPDGKAWTVRASGTRSSLKRAIWGRDTWIAVGTQGTIISSPDGVNWTPRGSGTADDLNDVAFGNGVFVVVGDHYPPNGTVLTSSDGVSWAYRMQSVGKNLRAVTFANGQFMALGNDGVILVSSNGVSWYSRASGITRDGANLRGVAWDNGVWIVVGNEGIVLTSTNTTLWTPRPARTLENLHGVAFLNGTFTTIGNRGTILQSARVIGAILVVQTLDPALGLELAIEGEIGRTHRLQASEDLRNWTDVFTFNNTQLTTYFVDEEAPYHTRRFYRVISP